MARSLQVAWEGTEEGAANLTLIKHPFNAQHERWGAPLQLLHLSSTPADLCMVLCRREGHPAKAQAARVRCL